MQFSSFLNYAQIKPNKTDAWLCSPALVSDSEFLLDKTIFRPDLLSVILLPRTICGLPECVAFNA